MDYIIKAVPSGIPDMSSGGSNIFSGTSAETGDFIADCVGSWWDADRIIHGDIKKSVIDTDSGPDTAGNRTRFIRRMTESADKSGLTIRSDNPVSVLSAVSQQIQSY